MTEQLLLHPRHAFREVEVGPPLSIRRLCVRRLPARAATRPRPTRWFPGTAPIIRLPLAGSGRTRNNRVGRKPASIGPGRLSVAEREEMILLEWELAAEGVEFGPPETWAECEAIDNPGPCPHVSCASNLYLDVIAPKRPGDEPVIKLNFPGLDIDEIPETCSRRAAVRGAATLEEIGKRLNITMGRSEQLEKAGLRKLAAVADAEGWGERFRHWEATAKARKH